MMTTSLLEREIEVEAMWTEWLVSGFADDSSPIPTLSLMESLGVSHQPMVGQPTCIGGDGVSCSSGCNSLQASCWGTRETSGVCTC